MSIANEARTEGSSGAILAQSTPPTISVTAEDGRSLLVIHPDGTVTGAIEDAGEAARCFVESLRIHWGVAVRKVEVTEDMVERMARMLFAQTVEARSGFTWPINGDWGRERDMEQARKVLEHVLTPASRAALDGGETAPKEAEPAHTPPERDPNCVAAWPECESFAYDPRCCRFPKSCSATIVPPLEVTP